MANYDTWIGRTAFDSDDRRVGSIEDLYFDDDTNLAMWATIKVPSLFSSKTHFAPVLYADETDEGVRFNVTQAAIRNAPGIDTKTDLSKKDEKRLRQYYEKSSV